ncbi:MAG TPA: OmpA family protein [Thermoanaerobaculia bacterium]|nr:OmpA family protein [Thermoanaerobaculia bacterium]
MSIFPSTVVSGGTATDSGGVVYAFPAGSDRFPFIVAPGSYRLAVTPPAAYRAPSQVPTAVLQTLPGSPFAIAEPGSRGEDFIVNPGPAVHIDIPVDPTGTGLWLVKTAGKQTAAVGDLVPYRLTVENSSGGILSGVVVTDRLPSGFRYRKGSARLNGASMADPAVSSDGRSLSFSIGNLDPLVSLKADIVYVAEVGAGVRPGTSTNTASAAGTPGAVSNTAHASVEIIEDLYRSTATIVGRVIVDGCGDKERSEEGGLAGIRIFREDGTFVVTDKNGMYHFAAVKPGTHVVQLDLATLPAKYEVLACEENTRFAGTAFSQFVDLQGGALWRADFHLGLRPKQIGEVGIEIMTAPKAPIPGEGKDLIEYTVPIHLGAVPARNLKLSIMLPEGAAYRKGTVIVTGGQKGADGMVSIPAAAPLAIDEPQETDGAVTFRFAELPANWEGTLRFDAAVALSGPQGSQLSTGAVLTSDSPEGRNNRTPIVKTALVLGTRDELRPAPDIVLHPRFESGSADLTAKDKEGLDRLIANLKKSPVEHITVTGHTDSRPIRARLQERYPDNYALSHERAASVGEYLADGLNLSHDQVTYEGKGPDEPVATNKTAEGRSQNRRVELRIKPTMRIVAVPALKSGPPSGMKAVATLGLRPGEVWQQEKPAEDRKNGKNGKNGTMPEFDAAWLAAAAPGAEWLWPPEGHQPPIAAVKLAAKHDPALVPRLILNGAAVDAIYCDGMRKNADGTIGVSRWSGVHLLEGDNRFELALTDAQGREVERLERSFHYSGAPVKAELVPEQSRLTADGRETAVLAVRFLDRDGHAAREGALGEFTVDPPYLAQQRAAQLQQSPLAAPATDRVRYQVGQDGIALIELAPTTRSGEAVVRFPLQRGEQEIRAWLRPEARDWVLVGLAEGTYGYNVVTGNRESLGAAGGEDNLYHEGRVAFYAKGVIKGEWLLTAAYDSAKETDGKRSMYQAVDPNKYYTLYGDATEQLNDAPSAKHVYVKLERGQFYALFGDFATGLTVTELSRYSRNLTGIKSEMKGDRFEYVVFAADTDQAHVKDELSGDGTSGLYHLSRRNIVINSETITIEARDRFKSEVIVSSQRLTRNVDYTIDYESGTLFFKSPVPSRDGSFNPVFIVAEYETFDGSNTSYTYGGRVAVNALDKRVQVGVSHVHEGPRGSDGEVTGVDATVQLTPETKLRAEVAQSTRDQAGITTEGTAYLAEVQHRSASFDGKVYIREQEVGFGLGQQNGSETGTRKVGGDLLYRIDPRWSVGGEVFRQENLATEAVRDMAEARVRYAMPGYEVFAGLRHAEDTLGTGEAHRSEQFFAGAKYQFTERLTGRVQHDQTLSSTDSSVDFPTRTTVGMDYRLTRDTTLFADQELTKGSQADTATSRIGIRSAPWTGAQVNSTMERQTTENGERLFATTGLKQAWQVTKRWSLDAGLDRSTTIHESGTYTLNTNVPPASGGTADFTAVCLGAAYRADTWSWTGRVEDRRAETEDKVGVYAGANGEVNNGLALAAGLQTFRTVSVAGPVKFTGDLRLGAAYRPRETRIIVLDRFDYMQAEQKGVDLPYDNWRVVNNVVLNYKLDGRMQWSFQYGAKYVTETIEKNDYRGYTDLTGIEGRYDITKKWDVGLRVSMLRSLAVDQTDYGTQASVGLLAGKNLWISLGYNFAGYTDRDFSKADFTAEGPFVKIRMKFDQASVREAVKWITGQ